MEQKEYSAAISARTGLQRAKAHKLRAHLMLEKIVTLSELLEKDHLDGITRGIIGRKLDELVKKL